MPDDNAENLMNAGFIEFFNHIAVRMHQTAKDKGWHDEQQATYATTAVEALLITEWAGDSLTDAARQRLFEVLLPFTQRTDGDFHALIHSEVSESLEGVRKPGPDRHCPEFSQIEVEMADTIIRIMDYGQLRGLRIAEALVAKAWVNEGRAHRHGGNTI